MSLVKGTHPGPRGEEKATIGLAKRPVTVTSVGTKACRSGLKRYLREEKRTGGLDEEEKERLL